MKPDIFETIAFSTALHLGLLFVLGHAPGKLNTMPSGVKTEVTIIEKSSNGQKPLKKHNIAKPLKSRGDDFGGQKGDEVDLTKYANRVKLKVDPVWVRNIAFNRKKFYLEVLLLVDKHGNIKSIKVIKPSGYSEIDETAVATFREVAILPIPPEIVVSDGIIWSLSNH